MTGKRFFSSGVWPMRVMATALFLMVPLAGLAQETTLFTLGSGDISGNYYASASAICDVINRAGSSDLRCSPDPTAGSIYNLDALRRGQIDFAMVQSDWQRSAYEGTGPYAAQGPMTGLRSVMSLYDETVSILAGRDSGIAAFADLRGKRIDPGLPSSGRRATVDRVLLALGLATADFAAVAELPAGVAIDALCSGAIDAAVLIVGHPNAAVARAVSECGARLIALSGAETDAVIRQSPDMRRATVPAAAYPGLTGDVPSVAVTATVVTRETTDPAIVSALVRETLQNRSLLARRIPVLAGLDPVQMQSAGLTAPLHPGAEAAFAQDDAP